MDVILQQIGNVFLGYQAFLGQAVKCHQHKNNRKIDFTFSGILRSG